MKCDISSFVVEANNYLADVFSQLMLIYAPLLACLGSENNRPAIQKEAKRENEETKTEKEHEIGEEETIASLSATQSLSQKFLEAYNVQCHVDGCTLSVAYCTNNTGSDV